MRITMRVIKEQRVCEVEGDLVFCISGLAHHVVGHFVVMKPAQGGNLAGFASHEAVLEAGICTPAMVEAGTNKPVHIAAE